jgi:hypothetical protein
MASLPTNVLSYKGLRVARCDFDGDMDSPEAHANARLVSIAPAMFDYIDARAKDGDEEAKQILAPLEV